MLNSDGAASNNLIDLLLDLSILLWMPEEVVEGKAEHARRSLVASDEEGDELVSNVLISQLLLGDRVYTVKHSCQQILPAGRVLLAGLHHLVCRFAHYSNVFGELFVGSAVHEVGDELRASIADAALSKEVAHGCDERMHVVAVI